MTDAAEHRSLYAEKIDGGGQRAGMAYDIFWEQRGVVKHYRGCVSSYDLLQSVLDTESDARFDDLRFVINDFLDIESLALANVDVEEISAIDRAAARINPHIKIAIVSISTDIIALGNEYANSPMNTYPTRIFATNADARAWLNAPAHSQ